MSRKSQETIGPNVDIPATTEFDASSLSLQQVAPYVARVPMRMAEATGLEPAASCVTGRRSTQLNYSPAYDSRLIPSDSLSFPPVPSGRAVTGQRSPDASQILCSE